MLHNGLRFVLGYRDWPYLEHPMVSAFLNVGVYCIFLPGVHLLTLNSPYGADVSLNKLLLLFSQPLV